MRIVLNEAAGAARGEPQGRATEVEAGRMVVRAVLAHVGGEPGAAFLMERAHAVTAALPAGPAARALVALLEATGLGESEFAASLTRWGGLLERHGELDAAREAYEAARRVAPGDAVVCLHCARAARRAGDVPAARDLYTRVSALTGPAHRLARLAAVGHALVGERPERDLARLQRDAQAAGDLEAAAVAREERAALRRARGWWIGAATDYARAALLYEEPVDRLRVVHAMADVLTAVGDVAGAREALLGGLAVARQREQVHCARRLHALARAQRDELGQRRWRAYGSSPLVSIAPSRVRRVPARSAAAPLRSWRARLEQPARVEPFADRASG